MEISISNIAWDPKQDREIATLLNQYAVKYIDIAPSKYFPKIDLVTEQDILAVKQFWNNQGIHFLGMQSLLFGTQNLNVFAAKEIQETMLAHLKNVCHIANVLGVEKLVFGSPKNRDRSGLTDQETEEKACEFFTQLGNIALTENVIICLEPNPVCYGANFMTTTTETWQMVKKINHKAIKMQLDTGAISINKENISQILSFAKNEIGHIHLSEPKLVPVGSVESEHYLFSRAIQQELNGAKATIEMLTSSPDLALQEIKNTLEFVTEIYK